MRLNTGFAGLVPVKLADKAEAIVAALTGNPDWPATTPTLAQISTATAALRHDIAVPRGMPGRAANIETARAALVTLLTQLGGFLMDTPNVTVAMLETTGYDLPKAPVRATAPPPAPTNLRLSHGLNPGDVLADSDPAEGARSYEGEWTLDPVNGPWNAGLGFPSARKMLFAGLPRGKDVWVRLRALGTKGFGPWGDQATIMVT